MAADLRAAFKRSHRDLQLAIVKAEAEAAAPASAAE